MSATKGVAYEDLRGRTFSLDGAHRLGPDSFRDAIWQGKKPVIEAGKARVPETSQDFGEHGASREDEI